MKESKLYPFMLRGSVGDTNTLVNSGMYYTTLTTLNIPFQEYAMLVVFNGYGEGQWALQMLVYETRNNIYFRMTTSKDFTDVPWKAIAGTLT